MKSVRLISRLADKLRCGRYICEVVASGDGGWMLLSESSAMSPVSADREELVLDGRVLVVLVVVYCSIISYT